MSERAGDAIGELIRLTGPATAVPAAIETRVRAEVLDAWQRKVGIVRRARRRRLVLALAASGLLAILAWPLLRPPATPPATAGPTLARVAALDGTVLLLRPGASRRPLEHGEPLRPGDRLDTGTGRAALRRPDGGELRLDTATGMRFAGAGEVALDHGGVYIDIGDGPPLLVRTPLGTARDIGTRFEVRLDTTRLRVRVRDGTVVLERAGRRHEARGGSALEVDAAGRVTRTDVAAYGAGWDWTARIAPSFPLDGATLESFLVWLGREAGWTVRYADPATEAAAKEYLLFGPPIAGLEPRQALDEVAAITGWPLRLDGATLHVARD